MPVHKDPMEGMGPPRVPVMAVEFVTDDELRAILTTCRSKSRHNYLGHRDEAILRLLATTAARLSEIALLKVSDVDLVGATVRVMGKGGRERYLPLDADTTASIRRYLERERPRHNSANTPPLWLSRGPMTPSGIAQMVAERGKMALGPAHRRIHPHELRHRQIATLLGAGCKRGRRHGHKWPPIAKHDGSLTAPGRRASAHTTRSGEPRLAGRYRSSRRAVGGVPARRCRR